MRWSTLPIPFRSRDTLEAGMELQLPMRVIVENPPSDVTIAMQRGRAGDLLAPTAIAKGNLIFEFSIRAANESGTPNFLGPFVHGPKGERFLYVNSGTLAGQADSPWTRRAKLHLSSIDWKLVQKVASKRGAVLEGRIAGTGRDGGPTCATTPIIGGWQWKEK
jgi:uncharacterized protein DUF5990